MTIPSCQGRRRKWEIFVHLSLKDFCETQQTVFTLELNDFAVAFIRSHFYKKTSHVWTA